ncbi:MAG TPA: hypothetical protein VI750_04915 [Pyrinomonadaceae bacterium]|nr:hypothetical protein [Pyrinomonadaceae bacterium]HLE62457.1 hypothetical protein [Pyrinomonadaceae bacterium]
MAAVARGGVLAAVNAHFLLLIPAGITAEWPKTWELLSDHGSGTFVAPPDSNPAAEFLSEGI